MSPSPTPRCLLALVLLLAFAPGLTAQERPLVVTGGHWFDVRSGEMRPNGGIVAVGGRLLAVGRIDAVVDTAGADRVVLRDDEYVLPGLVDLHAHYNVQFLGLPRREELVATPVLWLANGVTSTFPAGEYDPEGMRDLRLRIEAGVVPGPRLFNSGPYYGSTRPGWTKLSRDSLFAEVDLWAARGVRGFKAKNADPETLRWLIERAHRHGLTVTGHLGSGYRGSVNPRDAILMGIDRIEHFLGGDAFPDTRSAYASFPAFRPGTPEFDRITRLFIERGVTYDPTITAYAYYGVEGKSHPALEFWTDESRFLTPEVRAWVEGGGPDFALASFDDILAAKCPLVSAFHQAGGTLALATDHPSWGVWLPGFVAHREIHALTLCGIPEADALRIATLNGARAFGISDLLGSIEPGKLADFFVVRGNPLDDITNTRNIRHVVKSGTVYDPAALLRSVEGRMGVPEAARRAADREAGRDAEGAGDRAEEVAGDVAQDGVLEAVEALYRASSFTHPDSADLEAFRCLFTPDARLAYPRGDSLVVRTVDDYAQRRAQTLASGRLQALEEWELAGRTERFGRIAHRISSYAVRFDGADEISERGVISFQLVKIGDDWLIHSMTWDFESEDNPLPEAYEPAPNGRVRNR